MFEVSKEYQRLLMKYAGDEDFLKLVALCQQDEFRVRENHYIKNKTYPEQRDMLGKLATDLHTVRQVVCKKK